MCYYIFNAKAAVEIIITGTKHKISNHMLKSLYVGRIIGNVESTGKTEITKMKSLAVCIICKKYILDYC